MSEKEKSKPIVDATEIALVTTGAIIGGPPGAALGVLGVLANKMVSPLQRFRRAREDKFLERVSHFLEANDAEGAAQSVAEHAADEQFSDALDRGYEKMRRAFDPLAEECICVLVADHIHSGSVTDRRFVRTGNLLEVSDKAVAILSGGCVSKSAYDDKVRELQEAKDEVQELTQEMNGVEAQLREVSRPKTPGRVVSGGALPRDPKLAAHSLASKSLCSPWDCHTDCCQRKTITVPLTNISYSFDVCDWFVCYPTCDLHNAGCNPTAGGAIEAADPAYPIIAADFKLAVDKGALKYNKYCISLAEGNAELASQICSLCGGSVFCSLGSFFTEEEWKCICSELKLPDPPPPPPPPACTNDDCDSKKCHCSCKPPAVCHAECNCGKCSCLAGRGG